VGAGKSTDRPKPNQSRTHQPTNTAPTPTNIGPIPGCHTPLVAPPRGSAEQSAYCVSCRAPILREGEAFPAPPSSLSPAPVTAASASAAASPVAAEEEMEEEGKEVVAQEEGVQVCVGVGEREIWLGLW
jgi:hypothetical protein